MARLSLLPRRRPTVAPMRTLKASARKVDLQAAKENKLGRKPQGWHPEAWSLYEDVPEIHFTVRQFGSAMSKCEVYPVWDDPEDSLDPVPLRDGDGNLPDHAVEGGLTDAIADSAIAEMARLDRYADGGIPAVLERLNLNFEVPGECYLVGYAERDEETPELWEIRSVDEVVQKHDGIYIRDTPDQSEIDMVRLDPNEDTIIRLWIEHPRFRAWPDSSLRSILADGRALVGLSNEIIAETNSQASAGLLLIPNEVDTGGSDATSDDDEDEDPFMEDLAAALVDPIEDPEDPASVVPTVVRGEGEALDKVRHITFGRSRGDELDRRVESRIRRIARGLNSPVETTEGLGNTTFANAEVIDQDKWDDHYQPRATVNGAALTTAFLRPNLIDSHGPQVGDVVAKIRVLLDGKALIRQPNTEKNADKAHDSLAISDAARRKAEGFTEDDAPDEEELLRRMAYGAKAALTGDVTLGMLQVLIADRLGIDLTPDTPANISRPAPAPEGIVNEVDSTTTDPAVEDAEEPADLEPAAEPEPDETEDDDAVTAAAIDVHSEIVTAPTPGRLLMEIDRDLRARLVAAADVHLTAALERAGARVVSNRSLRDQISRTTPKAERCALLGRDTIVAAGYNVDELIGDWDGLEAQFRPWCQTALVATLAVIESVAPGRLTDADYDAIRDRFEVDLDEAWVALCASMTRLADERLFDASITAATGEIDPNSAVPAGVMRQAIAVAGGGNVELITDGNRMALALNPDGSPAGGIATGATARRTLGSAGAGFEGFRWVYGFGARMTPFDSHLALDGVTFENFDDPVLAVQPDDAWIGFSHYIPGDHGGCQCDFEPVVAELRPSPAEPDLSTFPEALTGRRIFGPEIFKRDARLDGDLADNFDNWVEEVAPARLEAAHASGLYDDIAAAGEILEPVDIFVNPSGTDRVALYELASGHGRVVVANDLGIDVPVRWYGAGYHEATGRRSSLE